MFSHVSRLQKRTWHWCTSPEKTPSHDAGHLAALRHEKHMRIVTRAVEHRGRHVSDAEPSSFVECKKKQDLDTTTQVFRRGILLNKESLEAQRERMATKVKGKQEAE